MTPFMEPFELQVSRDLCRSVARTNVTCAVGTGFEIMAEREFASWNAVIFLLLRGTMYLVVTFCCSLNRFNS